VVYVGAWTLAVLVGDRITQEAHDIASILFGTAVLVDDSDLVWVVAVAAVVALAHVFFHRGFVFAAFDPEGARVQGLPVATLDLMSWALVALAVAVTTRALGVLPVFACAGLPALAALAWVPRLRFVLPIAMAIGAASGGLGYLAAFFGELPVGASQAAVALGFFLAAWSSRAGVATLTRSWRLGSG
jgi:zinc transport system permease protein